MILNLQHQLCFHIGSYTRNEKQQKKIFTAIGWKTLLKSHGVEIIREFVRNLIFPGHIKFITLSSFMGFREPIYSRAWYLAFRGIDVFFKVCFIS